MEEEEGDTNSLYYSHLWNKELKRRIEPKRARLKKSMFFRNLLISTIEDLRRLHNKRKYATHPPLRR